MSLPRNFKVAAIAVAVLAVVGGLYLINQHEGTATSQSTDDAYVRADFTTVAPRVSGVLEQVLVEDNDAVRRGQLLAVIDDRDYKVALAGAEARLTEKKAAVVAIQSEIARHASVIRQARSAIGADNASLSLARANEARYRNLSTDGSGSVQEREQAEAQLRIHEAGLARDEAGLDAAEQEVAVLQASLDRAIADCTVAEAARDSEALKLSYTRISAAIDGTVGQRELRVGNFVTPGQPLLALVPLDRLYVEARFRETQLQNVRVGQSVTIRVDTLPGVVLNGRVESVAPATGVSFAPIAPDNATGNFTKVVQRLSVKIAVEPGQPDAKLLKAGMSVQPTVRTGDA